MQSGYFPFRRFSLMILLGGMVTLLTVAGCGTIEQVPANEATSWFLVTPNPNATPTPTPFQPNLPATPTPESTATQPPTEVPTLAPAEVIPTATVDPAQVTPSPTPIDLSTVPTAMPVSPDRNTINFLLLGSDTRGGTSFRTDTIVIAILHVDTGTVSMISIPRDTWVYIPTYGYQRINTAYLYGNLNSYPGGGEGQLKDTIMYNFGIPIDHVAMVDFDGFRRSVNAIGGIEVPVVCPYTDWRLIDPTLDPENEYNWALYTAGPGLVSMDGDLALWYARSRKRSNDFDRGRRQQEVIRAIYDKVLDANIVARLPQVYSELSSTVMTDMGFTDILSLAPLTLKLSNADIRSYYLNAANGSLTPWITPEGAYVLLPNDPIIQSILAQAMSPGDRPAEVLGPVVEVRNGTPYAGWDQLAGARLNFMGFETTYKPADDTNQTTTYLYDLSTSQDRTVTYEMLSALGLPQSALIAAPNKESETQYVLLIGTDYQPCFDPNQMNP